VTSSSEIYIQGTATDPAVRAQGDIRRVQESLAHELARYGVNAGSMADHDRAALADFCDQDLRSYLAAADQALYAPAAGAAETRLLVRALRATAADLGYRIDALSSASDAGSVAALAVGIEALLTTHLGIERAVLLPALAALPGTDLSALVGDFATLLGGGQLDRPATIDVRDIPHGQRHPRIFARYALLAPGEAFTLVNNHDPKPLRREFEATHPGTFTWEYLESGPERWQVRIGRSPRS
jgi:uncharacterized protein (DUF2249 family)